MQTGFTQELLSVELADTGWQLLENLAPSEIEAGYFQNRSDQYHAFEHFHFAKQRFEPVGSSWRTSGRREPRQGENFRRSAGLPPVGGRPGGDWRSRR